MTQYTELPEYLPVPQDDGACDHLKGKSMPGCRLNTTLGNCVDLSSLMQTTVLYVYPMTGQPGVALPDGWDEIPGARGCTPQSCSFRDHSAELAELNAQVYGISTQNSDYQSEVKQRLHLPFELLSDHQLVLKDQLGLPTFTVEHMQLYKRVTIIAEKAVITKVFYPVFPPDQNAQQVVNWLKQR